LCTETSSSSSYSQLPTISEPNADTDIIVVHTISKDKKIEQMQVLQEGYLNEIINVNNLITLFSEYPSHKSNLSETLTSADKHFLVGPMDSSLKIVLAVDFQTNFMNKHKSRYKNVENMALLFS
jgi:hypothetical protein